MIALRRHRCACPTLGAWRTAHHESEGLEFKEAKEGLNSRIYSSIVSQSRTRAADACYWYRGQVAARTATAWQEAGQLIRFHIGLEDTDDLIADLAQAIQRLD